MILQEPVKAAIWHCLDHYDYLDAVFLSERLHAEVKTDDSLFMLATAYYRSGKMDHAYYVLKDRFGSTPQCRYLFGCCAYEMQKYFEAEAALLEREGSFDSLITEFGEQASFALFLLAKILVKTERRGKAAEAFRKALKLNPFLWSSFVELCNLGEKPNPNSIFQVSSSDNVSLSMNNVENMSTPNMDTQSFITPQQLPILNQTRLNSKVCSPDESPLANPLCLSGLGLLPPSRIKPLRNRLASGSISPQPSFGQLQFDSPDTFMSTPIVSQTTLTEVNDQHKSLAKKVRAHMGHLINRKEPHLQNSKPVFSQSSNTISPSTPTPATNIQSNVRRSSRIFSSHSYSVKENNKSPNRNKFATPKSPSRKTKQRFAKCNLTKTDTFTENAKNRLEKEKAETITSTETKNSAITSQQAAIKQSAEGLMCLLRSMGQAYLNLSQFNCKTAIVELNNLPSHHHTTTWVYSMIGLAYFEMSEYENCINYFSEIRSKEPYRIDYMDIYSSALWHLQKEVTLSALAQELIQLNKNSSITWCVNGNCFSLHKEHDTAIKFLQRAVQVDPSCAYAYTLLGHEYIMTEELDKAMSCFRNAIRINHRHYNAWFGIGTIYSKQERYQLAEINYWRALSINPHNSVLMCHVGMVQHALKKSEKALQTFNTAISNDNKNALCKFHRGSIYFALGRHAEALKELEELKEIVPKESLVYYLMGKVHKKLGNTDLALMHFSWATDLDPKGASSQIREAFDPTVGRNANDAESSTSPTVEEYQSESNSVQQQEEFVPLPEESDDSA
ncbi:hypothetical protein PPYR_09836 [Photinus pyralis]|uniref:Cell division cycle protein 27 homolog n=1 Tax=Photinus pyralis TaxID=7054 RepID=A0A1Y1KFQ5_PHOPY|nr:cell division cycle protein 27 homolog [Photinus pyralis]KAB0795775.1 hypothetical protein PPYR_09836 [Photinus pyralis]